MKRVLSILLLIVLLLSACTAPGTGERSFTDPTATEPASTEPVWTPYTGTTKDYVYYHTKTRDLEWEEDVLYVAGVFLGDVFANGHPYLTDATFVTEFALDGHPREILNHYDAQKRAAFLQDINDLIPQISDLRDYEIIYLLEKAVAKLGDLHSSVYPVWDYVYPIWLTPIYTDGGAKLYATCLPEKYEAHLNGELVAINGIPIEEIKTRMLDYISYENEHAALDSIRDYLQCNEMLTMCGVTGYKEIGTQFTLQSADGTQHTIALDAMTYFRASTMDYAGTDEEAAGFLTHAKPDELYWWEYLEEDGILYARLNHVQEDYYGYNYSAFTGELISHIKAGAAGQTVVIDFRYNPGGYFDPSLAIKLASVLNMEQVEKAYVLINGASYSGAIMMPASIRQLSEKAVLVGSPGGQPTNFYASNYTYTMPNSGQEFCMSDSWWMNDPSDTGSALMPDIVIHQTLEDLLGGRDTVMEAIKAGTLP